MGSIKERDKQTWGIESLPQTLIFLIPTSLRPNFVYHIYLKYMTSVETNSLSLKYQRFTPSGCKDIGIAVCGNDSTPLSIIAEKNREAKKKF